jgi:UDP-glucose 4-epimerase
MAAFLVTGGAGFMGSCLVENLVARGHTVRVYDNLSTGVLSNLDAVRQQIQVFTADVKDRQALEPAMHGVDCVFHFAAPPSEAYENSGDGEESWTQATDVLSVLTAARKAGVRRVVYASSGSVYAHPEALQVQESDPIVPLSRFAFTKLTGEHQCLAFASVFGLETVRLRYFNVFGPRQSVACPQAAAVPVILKAMLAGQSPVLVENVYDYQDYLYVDDAVHGAILAAEVARASSRAYNLGRGRPTNLLGLVAAVNEILGTKLQPLYSPARVGDYPPRVVSIAKAERELGFCPRADLKQGLKALIDYYVKQGEQFGADGAARHGRSGPHSFNKDRAKLDP